MLGLVLDKGRLHELETGQELFAESSPGNSLFLLLEGVVELFKQNLRGEMIEMGKVPPGNFLGELSLLDPESFRMARAAAGSRSLVWEISRDTVTALLQRQPETVCRNLLRQAATHLHTQNQHRLQHILDEERHTERMRVVRSILLRQEDPATHLLLFAGHHTSSETEFQDLHRTIDELASIQEDLRLFLGGLPPARLEILDARGWALSCWETFRRHYPRRSARLQTYFEESALRGDPHLLSLALTHALKAACRLATPDTAIELRGGRQGGEYLFLLSYWQADLDELTALRLFEPFLILQEHNKPQTTWLDFKLAAMILEAMSGSARVEHRAGEKITLAFTLPSSP